MKVSTCPALPAQIALLALLATLALLAGGGRAEAGPAKGDTPTLSVTSLGSQIPDSAASAHPPRTPGTIARPMAGADSAVKQSEGTGIGNDVTGIGNAELFLSWNAPWGDRRARRTRVPECADSVAQDTLYLSFMPGLSVPRFTGFTAHVFFRATGGDSLGSWWHMEGKTGENPDNILVQWSFMEDFPGRSPYPVGGQGGVFFDHTPHVARLRLVSAIPYDRAGPVTPGVVYSLGRVIFKHHPARGLTGCDQPVVLEWGVATLALGPIGEQAVHAGERFVSWGGPYSIVEPFKGPRVEAWRPKPPATK